MPPSLQRVTPIKEIQQDCGGASVTTWLAMAASHAASPAPWEIYEEYSHQTYVMSTISSFVGAKDKYLLSEYLYNTSHICQDNSSIIKLESQDLEEKPSADGIKSSKFNIKIPKLLNPQALLIIITIIMTLNYCWIIKSIIFHKRT